MNVFKFGGTSVKNQDEINNLVSIVRGYGGYSLVIVISAMGKMTNALEKVVDSSFKKKADLDEHLNVIQQFHDQIVDDLFPYEYASIRKEVSSLLHQLETVAKQSTSENYNYIYDQIICFGELLSTKIISAFLNKKGCVNEWVDARLCIKTDDNYRKATVNWKETGKNIKSLKMDKPIVTQGFIASDSNNKTTSLGREGSDFSASIFAYSLNANQVTIWKDVDGVLNADPRHFDNPILLNQISYEEAVELAFYGASVIHPKTIQPLQQKNIPLHVKSFVNPELPGTSVRKRALIEPLVPCFIVKKNQHFLRISDKNFSFIVENHISELFEYLDVLNFRVNLMQNSAIYFSLCVDDKFNNFPKLKSDLEKKYNMDSFENVSLYTIRHCTKEALASVVRNKTVILRQATPKTVQVVTAN